MLKKCLVPVINVLILDKHSESSLNMPFRTPQFKNLESGKLLVSSCSLLAKRLDCYKVRGFKTLPSTHPYNVFVTYSLLEGSISNINNTSFNGGSHWKRLPL